MGDELRRDCRFFYNEAAFSRAGSAHGDHELPGCRRHPERFRAWTGSHEQCAACDDYETRWQEAGRVPQSDMEVTIPKAW